MPNQHRPARVTTNLGIPVSGDDDNADYVTAWGKTADEADARITAAVASAERASIPFTLMMMGA